MGRIPNLRLHVTRSLENLSSGEKRADFDRQREGQTKKERKKEQHGEVSERVSE